MDLDKNADRPRIGVRDRTQPHRRLPEHGAAGGHAAGGRIPPVATGLVYENGGPSVYGWHMWTQAIVDGHWIDLDATMPVPFTIGHVLVDTSSLADDTGIGDQYNMLALIGNMEIDVLEVDVD